MLVILYMVSSTNQFKFRMMATAFAWREFLSSYGGHFVKFSQFAPP